jgi:hypothetical protein
VPLIAPPAAKTTRSVPDPPVMFFVLLKPICPIVDTSVPESTPVIVHTLAALGPEIVLLPGPPSKL